MREGYLTDTDKIVIALYQAYPNVEVAIKCFAVLFALFVVGIIIKHEVYRAT